MIPGNFIVYIKHVQYEALEVLVDSENIFYNETNSQIHHLRYLPYFDLALREAKHLIQY
jgi:hypothetical protein